MKSLKQILICVGLLLSMAFASHAESVPNESKDSANLDESQIPLNFANPTEAKKEDASGTGVIKWISVIVMLSLLGGSMIYLRRKSMPTNKTNAFNIKVLGTHHLGPRRSLYIIHVAGEAMLLGVTDSQINLIKPLALIDDEMEKVSNGSDFSKSLSQSFDQTDEEDFAYQSIRGVRQWS